MLSEIFQKPKPILGPVHLLALPGSAGWDGDWGKMTARAEQEAAALATGGVDGLVVENRHDAPFSTFTAGSSSERTDPAAAIALATIIRHLRKMTGLPVGLSLLQNDPETALAIAINSDAAFIRLAIPAGARITPTGVINNRLHDLLRYQNQLKSSLPLILADITLSHIVPGMPLMGASNSPSAQQMPPPGCPAHVSGELPANVRMEIVSHLLRVVKMLPDSYPIIPVLSDGDLTPDELALFRKAIRENPVLVESQSNPIAIDEYFAHADGILLERGIRKQIALRPEHPPTIEMTRVEEIVNRLRGVPSILEMDPDLFLQPEARCPVDLPAS